MINYLCSLFFCRSKWIDHANDEMLPSIVYNSMSTWVPLNTETEVRGGEHWLLVAPHKNIDVVRRINIYVYIMQHSLFFLVTIYSQSFSSIFVIHFLFRIAHSPNIADIVTALTTTYWIFCPFDAHSRTLRPYQSNWRDGWSIVFCTITRVVLWTISKQSPRLSVLRRN